MGGSETPVAQPVSKLVAIARTALPALREAFAVKPQPLFADTRPFALANELDPARAELCARHAARAEMDPYIESVAGDCFALEPAEVFERVRARGLDPAHGLILSNPPYGERMDEGDPRALYRELGRYLRGFPGWRAAFLVANPEFELAIGMTPRIKKPLSNGPLRGYFLMYDL
jgi:23S rRNA G2445 N2-methylase RlmL